MHSLHPFANSEAEQRGDRPAHRLTDLPRAVLKRTPFWNMHFDISTDMAAWFALVKGRTRIPRSGKIVAAYRTLLERARARVCVAYVNADRNTADAFVICAFSTAPLSSSLWTTQICSPCSLNLVWLAAPLLGSLTLTRLRQ